METDSLNCSRLVAEKPPKKEHQGWEGLLGIFFWEQTGDEILTDSKL